MLEAAEVLGEAQICLLTFGIPRLFWYSPLLRHASKPLRIVMISCSVLNLNMFCL